MNADLVFWQGGLSIHQAPLISEISSMGIKTVIVVPAILSEGRRRSGWNTPSLGDTKVEVLPDVEAAVDAARRYKNACHVVSGFGYRKHIQRAFWALAENNVKKLAVMSESWDPRGIRGLGRRVKYQSTVGRMKPHLDLVFTNGALAAKQYRSVGISSNKIRPFGYFVNSLGDSPASANSDFKIIYVGRLISLKRVNLLLNSLSRIPGNWSLTIIGDGDQRNALERQVDKQRLRERISFVGATENSVVHNYIAHSDLLVLPSAYDGWGAVVNEALMNGTPALVSSACGASELITSTLQGEVFRSRDAKSLTDGLRRRIASGPLSVQERKLLKQWAEVSISPEAAAQYLWRNLTTSSPASPPWS